MMYRLECSWLPTHGKILHAAKMADAVPLFATLVHGNQWQSAKVFENDNSAIVICPDRRPFKITTVVLSATVMAPAHAA